MKYTSCCLFFGAAIIAIAPPALSASDYLLQFDDVAGKATANIEIQSWSLGASNPTVADEVAKKGGGASVGKTNAGKLRVASSEPGADSIPVGDLAVVAKQDVVEGFSLTFDKASPALASLCAQGQHIKNAKIVGRGAVYDLQIASMTGCPKPTEASVSPTATASSERISMNVTVPKQTQGATFGEKVNQGLHMAGSVIMRFTGQMKQQKTGHVTLMK